MTKHFFRTSYTVTDKIIHILTESTFIKEGRHAYLFVVVIEALQGALLGTRAFCPYQYRCY
jgi:hypothetical protein